jgi:predicted cobalt transporter CbtA
VLFAAMPPNPDAVTAPANLVWQFRVNSLTGNLLVWTLLTLGLGVTWAEAARRAAAAPAQNSMPFNAEMPAS